VNEMHPEITPNHWRVITVAPDEGKAPDTFYVLRTPPNLAFATDERGNRRAFATYDSAQIVADSLNAKESP